MENRHLTVEEEDESLYSGYNDYNATFDSEVLATMVIRELQESQVSVSDRLAQQKQRLIELHDTSNVLDRDLENLQDTKDRNLAHLVALQSRAKKLQAACEGRYRALTDSESVGAAQQRQMERVHTVNAILHRVCEEFPQYQGVLRKPLKALAAGIQDLEQEKSDVDLTVSTGGGVQIEGEINDDLRE